MVKITLDAASPVPTYNVAPWSSGVLEARSGEASGGSSVGLLADCSPVGEYADIAGGGNYAAIGEWTVTLNAATDVGAKWWVAFLAAGASISGAKIELWDTTAAASRFVGTVMDATLSGVEVEIACESITAKRHKEIPARRLTAAEFPGLSESFEGSAVPIVYGPAERLEPASFLTAPEYLSCLLIDGAWEGDSLRTSTFLAYYVGAPVATTTFLPVVTGIGTTEQISEVDAALAVGKLYVLISAGTGNGQERKVSSISYTYGATAKGVLELCAGLNLATPLGTVPDETSEIRLIRREIGAILAVCDEGVVLTVRDGEYNAPVPFASGTLASGIVTADVSAEFAAGESYSSVEYTKPSDVFGIPQLMDGLSASNPNVARGYPLWESPFSMGYVADLFCRSRLDLLSIPNDLIEKNPDIYGLASLAVTDYPSEQMEAVYFQAKATRFDGEEEFIGVITDIEMKDGGSVNSFSPAMATDGTPGNFAGYATKINLERPLSQYKEILIGAILRGALTYIIGGDRYGPEPIDSVQNIPFVNGHDYVLYDGGIHDLYPDMWISPTGDFDGQIKSSSDSYTGVGGSAMYQIISTELVSGHTYKLTLDREIEIPTGSYPCRISGVNVGGDEPMTVNEYESGFALVFGDIPQDSVFVASMESGRKSSGTPIIYAKDAAADILSRDLGLGAGEVDTASFAALPDQPVRMSVVDVESSAEIIARMAREFNWIIGHDGTGKERAKTWLDRVGTSSTDWSVTSADIVKDSVTPSLTSTEDTICEPQTAWDWTYADGFRQKGRITDISKSPASITAGNYLQTISGFGEYAASLAIYTAIHANYLETLERGQQAIEYRYGGNPTDLYAGALAAWLSARKPLLDFKVPEDRACAACVVGDRITITHKRYTNNIPRHGTICGRWWHPMDGVVQILAMMDPT